MWTCGICTYRNENDNFLACEICGSPRPECAAAAHTLVEEESVAPLVRRSSDSLSPAQRIKRFWENTVSPRRRAIGRGEIPIEDDWVQIDPMPSGGDVARGAHFEEGSVGSTIAEENHLKILSRYLPRQVRDRAWRLLYSLSRDGTSLETLLRRSSVTEEPCILLVRDTVGHRFGAFLSSPWRRETEPYGTGESFVFDFDPGYDSSPSSNPAPRTQEMAQQSETPGKI